MSYVPPAVCSEKQVLHLPKIHLLIVPHLASDRKTKKKTAVPFT